MVNPTIEQIQAHILMLNQKRATSEEEELEITCELDGWLTILEHKVEKLNEPAEVNALMEYWYNRGVTTFSGLFDKVTNKLDWSFDTVNECVAVFLYAVKAQENLPDDYEQLHRDICEEANDDLAMEIDNAETNGIFNGCRTLEELKTLKYGKEGSDTRIEFEKKAEEFYFGTIQEEIIPDTFDIIHAVPFGSNNYQFVAKIPAYSLDNAFVNSQNGFTDLVWIQNFHGIDVKSCRSTSVGDIIGHNGKYYLVKEIGFEEVDSPFPMNEI